MAIPEWVVTDVRPQKDYTLLLKFADGSNKIYDARPLLQKPIFARLKSPGFFLGAQAKHGTVVWDDETDIAPEHLYERSTPLDVTTPDDCM